MLDDILAILNTVGQVVDTPWAAVRTGIRDRSIGSGLESIFDVDQRATGREMLESLGMAENQPGLDWGDVAGFGAEVIPDMLLPGMGAYKILKYLRPAAEAAPIGRGFLDAIDKAVPTPNAFRHIDDDMAIQLLDELTAVTPLHQPVQATKGMRYRAFDEPQDFSGADRSFASEPFGWGGAYEAEFIPNQASPIAHHTGAFRGEALPESVRRLFFDPDYWVDPNIASSHLRELRKQMPLAEFVQVAYDPLTDAPTPIARFGLSDALPKDFAATADMRQMAQRFREVPELARAMDIYGPALPAPDSSRTQPLTSILPLLALLGLAELEV